MWYYYYTLFLLRGKVRPVDKLAVLGRPLMCLFLSQTLEATVVWCLNGQSVA